MSVLKSFLKGFFYAGRGIAVAIRQERNLRIHLTAAFYVAAAALLAEFDGLRLAVLCLCFGLVPAAELFNTAIERVCDAADQTPNPLIQVAKDTAAGGVLLTAAATVLVGVCFFASAAVWQTIWRNLSARPFLGVFLLLAAPAFLVWIVRVTPHSIDRPEGKND
ncbi:MAG: diacylglycerol kinase [Oscillospiraceae bacterium]|nr:diacylglycerol kinase [Oscillospiraceae bacterium]